MLSPEERATRRDANGRFLPGWKGGPGNTKTAITREIRRGLLRAVAPEEHVKIARLLAQIALEGEPNEECLWNRVLGRPPQTIVATDEDGNALPLDLRRLALEAIEIEITEMMAPAVREEAERLFAEGVVTSAGGNGRVARRGDERSSK